jgi:hypothetical protein
MPLLRLFFVFSRFFHQSLLTGRGAVMIFFVLSEGSALWGSLFPFLWLQILWTSCTLSLDIGEPPLLMGTISSTSALIGCGVRKSLSIGLPHSAQWLCVASSHRRILLRACVFAYLGLLDGIALPLSDDPPALSPTNDMGGAGVNAAPPMRLLGASRSGGDKKGRGAVSDASTQYIISQKPSAKPRNGAQWCAIFFWCLSRLGVHAKPFFQSFLQHRREVHASDLRLGVEPRWER